MKFDIDEVYFVKSALEVASIKVSDAKFASDLMSKIDKEFVRLQKLSSKDSVA